MSHLPVTLPAHPPKNCYLKNAQKWLHFKGSKSTIRPMPNGIFKAQTKAILNTDDVTFKRFLSARGREEKKEK
jgi:hypothetical protein